MKDQTVLELTNEIWLKKKDNKAPGDWGDTINKAHAACYLGFVSTSFRIKSCLVI